MNQRNVEALKAVLVEALEATTYNTPSFVGFLARELAAYGVLVPSALTDEQAYEIDSAWCSVGGQEDKSQRDEVVRCMERIAMGENMSEHMQNRPIAQGDHTENLRHGFQRGWPEHNQPIVSMVHHTAWMRGGPTLYLTDPTLGPMYRMWAVRYWNERIEAFFAEDAL